MNNLQITEYKNIRVLTTQQIAEAYGTDSRVIDTQKLSKLTGIPPSTLYQRLSQPDNIRISELREILRVLKITDEEKAKIGREVI